MLGTEFPSDGGSKIKKTVMSLNPSKPLSCLPNVSIYEICKLMNEKRENCVLVIDENDELLGIFTAKDIAFRVIGNQLDIFKTKVEKIMTTNPMCAKINTKASDALDIMIIKNFRHLPIVNQDNQIIGVLDITKCYLESIKKLEELYENSKNMYNAMESVNKQLIKNVKHNYMIKYFENLKKILSGPTLNEILNDESTKPIYCNNDCSVYDTSILMKDNKTTAILIKDKMNNETIGIFTSKDLISRVISKDLDPYNCTIDKVMTKNLSSALYNVTINDALKQMFKGKYLNLPIINDYNEIIGIVDVIRLTNFTIKQIQTMESFNEDDEDDDEEDDEFTNFLLNNFNDKSNGKEYKFEETEFEEDEFQDLNDVSFDELSQFDIKSIKSNNTNNTNNMNNMNRKFNQSIKHKNSIISIVPSDYNELCLFKIKVLKGKNHRLSFKPNEGFKKLKNLIKEEFKNELNSIGSINISYYDEDKDLITINSDKELKDCVILMKNLNFDKIELIVHDSNENLEHKSKISGNISNGNDLSSFILPISLFTLAGTIAVVFTLSRR